MSIMYKRLGDKLLEIFQDENAESPRDWDNLGKMELFHRDYNFPHEGGFKDDPEGLKEYLNKSGEVAVWLSVYMYEHSGVALSTGNGYPFNDPWDAGLVGFIYATKEDIKKEYNIKRITEVTLKKVIELLKGEVETYSKYLNGEVYGFILSKVSTCNHGDEHKDEIDSCWGFFDPEDIISDMEDAEEWKKVPWEYSR